MLSGSFLFSEIGTLLLCFVLPVSKWLQPYSCWFAPFIFFCCNSFSCASMPLLFWVLGLNSKSQAMYCLPSYSCRWRKRGSSSCDAGSYLLRGSCFVAKESVSSSYCIWIIYMLPLIQNNIGILVMSLDSLSLCLAKREICSSRSLSHLVYYFLHMGV